MRRFEKQALVTLAESVLFDTILIKKSRLLRVSSNQYFKNTPLSQNSGDA
jgi:hypothetical protein